MSLTARLWIPELPPSDNARLLISRGRGVKPTVRRAGNVTKFFGTLALLWERNGLQKFPGWVVLRVWIVWPDQRVRDPGNILKVLCDALKYAGAVVDDKFILPRIEAVAVTGRDGFLGFALKEHSDGTYSVPTGSGIMIEMRPAHRNLEVPPYRHILNKEAASGPAA